MIENLTTIFVGVVMFTIFYILYEFTKPLPPIDKRQYRVINNGKRIYSYSAQVHTGSQLFGWADVQALTSYRDEDAAIEAIEAHKQAGKIIYEESK